MIHTSLKKKSVRSDWFLENIKTWIISIKAAQWHMKPNKTDSVWRTAELCGLASGLAPG